MVDVVAGPIHFGDLRSMLTNDAWSPHLSESYTPSSPGSPALSAYVSRRKSSLPMRSPSSASAGEPGVILHFELGGQDGQFQIHAVHVNTSATQPLPSSPRQEPLSVSLAPRLPIVKRKALAMTNSGLVTPPASDTEDGSETDDSSSDAPVVKRFKKEKSPPIIARHSGLKKECGACGTKKTPYWRDGWDKNVILCNACGIRFQKYRTRCSKCSYIPRKEEKVAGDCTHCGGAFI